MGGRCGYGIDVHVLMVCAYQQLTVGRFTLLRHEVRLSYFGHGHREGWYQCVTHRSLSLGPGVGNSRIIISYDNGGGSSSFSFSF